jgi:hypothetical protein
MRRGVLEQTFLSEVKVRTLGTFEQSPCLLHSYKNITGTLPQKLEHYHAKMDLFTRGAKDFVCALFGLANALRQRLLR